MKILISLIFTIFSIVSFSQEIFIPNAFTPDGDFTNDYFGVYCIERDSIDKFSMTIYNSYGEIVFKTNEIGDKWLGGEYYYGSSRPFVYNIEYRKVGTFDIIRKSGFILLVR